MSKQPSEEGPLIAPFDWFVWAMFYLLGMATFSFVVCPGEFIDLL